ncbi:mobile element protein [Streptomyces sp. NL15-2K]|nr:mobile element protein [Streptomyces sp. NL15-2K]
MNTDELEWSLMKAERRVLGIQTKLHRWANDDSHRRFDDLFNLVADPAFLLVAWDRVRGNKGARTAGVGAEALTKTIARYGRVDLLCIDELGYMELDRRGAELLFQVLTEREEENSVAIASNESFGGWTKTFTDPRLCAAVVDRLTFGGNIIETGTESFRLASTRAARAQDTATG